MTPFRLGALLAVLVAAVDQATKWWIVEVFDIGARGPVPLVPSLDLALAHNRGISYSMFRADSFAGQAMLIGVALIALGAIGVWLWRTRSYLTGVALGLVAGGAVGNLIDRVRIGAVVDFLYFHTPFSLGPLSNYVFNGADAAITGGVILLLYESLTASPRAPKRTATD